MGVHNYSITLGRDLQSHIGGYYSRDGTHIIIPHGPKSTIVYIEDRLVPYIENLPELSINHIEDDLRIYSIFHEEEWEVAPIDKPPENFQDVWQMFFDGASFQYGNGVGILLQDDFRKRHTFSFRLKFASTNHTTEFRKWT